MSFNPHETLIFFKQCKWSDVAVKFDGHGSQENSKTLSTILLFFSQTQLNPWFIEKKP